MGRILVMSVLEPRNKGIGTDMLVDGADNLAWECVKPRVVSVGAAVVWGGWGEGMGFPIILRVIATVDPLIDGITPIKSKWVYGVVIL